MTDVPPWIDDRLEYGPSVDRKLTQRHVVEVLLESERPFFSITQVQARISPDVSRETVRNRLDELREIDVVAAETYPDSLTLYYVNHPDSNWPLSPEGKRALAHDSPLETLSAGEFLRLRNPAGIRTLVLAGFQLSLLLFCLGTVLLAVGVDGGVSSDSQLWAVAGNLLLVSLGVLVAERIAREIRSGRTGNPIPTLGRSRTE